MSKPKELAAKNHKTVLVVDHAIKRIISKGTQRLYNKYLKTQMPEHLAAVHRKQTENVIDQHALPNDTGEKIDTLLMYWCEEEQPECANLDSWAALSIKSQYRPEAEVTEVSGTKSQDKSLLQNLNNSRRSILVSNLRPLSAGMFSLMGSTISQAQAGTRRAKSARNRGPKYIPEIVPAYDPEHDPEPDNPALDRMRSERDLIKMQRLEEINLKRAIFQQEKEREEARRKMGRKLYDRIYTYDYEGKVVMIKPPDAENLPDTSIEPDTVTNKPPMVIKNVPYETKEIGASKKIVQPKPTPRVPAANVRTKKILAAKDFPYPKTPALEEVLKVQMGVKMSTKGHEVEGPPITRPNKMTRDEYLQIIDAKMEQQKEHYKKLAMGPDFVDHVLEEAMKKQEDSINKKLEEAYQTSPDSEKKKSKKPQLHIHDQEQLVKMLVESPMQDPKEKEEEAKRIKRHQRKIKAQKIIEEEEQRAKEILDHVSAYERDVEGEIKPKNPENKKAVGLHKNVEEFNQKISHDADWGRPMPRTNRTVNTEGDESSQLIYSEKRKIKMQTLDPHIPNEPRVRLTITQKLSKIVSPNQSRPQTAMKSPASAFNQPTNKTSQSGVSVNASGNKQVFLKMTKENSKKVVKLPSISTSSVKNPADAFNSPIDAFKSPSTVKSTTAGIRTIISPNDKSQADTTTNRDSTKKSEKFFLSNSRITPKGNIDVTIEASNRPQTQSSKRLIQ